MSAKTFQETSPISGQQTLMLRKLTCQLLATILLVGVGCDADVSEDSAQTANESIQGKGGAGVGSQEDPMEVLNDFVAAVKSQDKERCVSLVHPSNREELSRDMERGFPPVPEPLNLQIEMAADGQSARFSGVPALKNLRLRKYEGKWWIVD